MNLAWKLSRIFCVQKFSIDTALPPEQVCKTLHLNAQAQPPRLGEDRPSKPFCGLVGPDSFSIRPCARTRVSFCPVLDGRLSPAGGGTRVDVGVRMSWFVLAVWAACIAFVGLLLYTPGDPSHTTSLICGFLLVTFCLTQFAFWLEAGRARSHLSALLVPIP